MSRISVLLFTLFSRKIGVANSSPDSATPENKMQAQNTEQVICYLEDIIAEAKSKCARIGLFPALFRKVTLKLKQGIDNHLFVDNSLMEEFSAQFANRSLLSSP
ncbi:MAG: hypothetical protein HRU34_21955 [Richelia sp.]|nr:hypothetical protein [Richelia sp.]